MQTMPISRACQLLQHRTQCKFRPRPRLTRAMRLFRACAESAVRDRLGKTELAKEPEDVSKLRLSVLDRIRARKAQAVARCGLGVRSGLWPHRRSGGFRRRRQGVSPLEAALRSAAGEKGGGVRARESAVWIAIERPCRSSGCPLRIGWESPARTGRTCSPA